jgi:hypothetical protein
MRKLTTSRLQHVDRYKLEKNLINNIVTGLLFGPTIPHARI